MINVGLVGTGRWGRILARSFSNKCNIKRFSSHGNKKNIDLLSRDVPNAKLSTLNDILNDDDIDAVIIASSIESLSNIAIQCLEADKHIFLEKPAGTSSSEIEKIKKSRNKKVCLVDYLYLSDPVYQVFKKEVQKRKILKIDTQWNKWGSFNNDILVNLACHDISMIIDMLGNDLKIRKSNVQDDYCIINFVSETSKASIIIDRKSRFSKKIVSCVTDKETFIWSPGRLILDDDEIKKEDSKLVDIQRDIFLTHIEKNSEFSNLDMAGKIMSIIEELRK